ncbi:capsule assembly Wzi family protein [Sulfurihydrogenibium azorense]|uniref:capsule assembly Wzi family protein n=1 Tax=Sulfurihydrogenibium azorense TaxID=309806 RepID=UPI0039195568
MKKLLSIIFLLLLIFKNTNAYENLFIPLDMFNEYRKIDLGINQRYTTTGIKPYTCEKSSVVYSQLSNFCKDIFIFSSTDFKLYYTNNKNAFSIIPEEEGIKLEKGINNILQINGGLNVKDRFSFYYETRLIQTEKDSYSTVHRATFSLFFNNLIITTGKDNIKVGPSKYGNLFSSTNPPFYQINLRNNKPYEFFGLLDFILMYGYLKEDRKDHSNPNLVFARLDYKPSRFLEIGVNRAVLFGGEGRPSYKIYEYPKVFYGSEETTGGRFDNDSYLGYDIKIDFPFKSFDIFQIYYENNATDVESPLKKGDPKKIHFPLIIFKFHDNAETIGLKLKRKDIYLNLEYTSTGKSMYINHNYPQEGLSYKGFILGYPYGRSIEHIFLEFGKVNNDSHALFEIGYLKQPVDISTNLRMKDYYSKLTFGKNFQKFSTNVYTKIDYFKNLNIADRTNDFKIINENKVVYTLGISLNYKF